MRRVALFLGIILSGGIWTASAVAAPAVTEVHAPSPTAVVTVPAPACPTPEAAPAVEAAPGSTAITFTLVAPGCE